MYINYKEIVNQYCKLIFEILNTEYICIFKFSF